MLVCGVTIFSVVNSKQSIKGILSGIDDLTARCKALSNQLTDEKLKAKVLISITKAKTEKELQRIYDKLKVVA